MPFLRLRHPTSTYSWTRARSLCMAKSIHTKPAFSKANHGGRHSYVRKTGERKELRPLAENAPTKLSTSAIGRWSINYFFGLIARSALMPACTETRRVPEPAGLSTAMCVPGLSRYAAPENSWPRWKPNTFMQYIFCEPMNRPGLRILKSTTWNCR